MIYTFYSYKGGVGRTHALANLAAYLCYYKQRRILLIDWDLEAPGLHFYFGKNSNEITSLGLIDILEQHISILRNAEAGTTLTEEDFFNPLTTEASAYTQRLIDAPEGGSITLMPATRYVEGYQTKIESFMIIYTAEAICSGYGSSSKKITIIFLSIAEQALMTTLGYAMYLCQI
jgi:hypothetical protein